MNYLDVPVIDFSNAYSENVNERSKLAEEIGNVVTNIGFLVDEPYLGPVITGERAEWADKHSRHMQASQWQEMYYPG